MLAQDWPKSHGMTTLRTMVIVLAGIKFPLHKQSEKARVLLFATVLLTFYYRFRSYKCFYIHFLDRTVRLFILRKKKSTKLDFPPNRFGNFGRVQYVYLKIKRNSPNNMYNSKLRAE